MIIRKIFGFYYKYGVKPVLFKFDPEFVHDSHTYAAKILSIIPFAKIFIKKIFRYEHPSLEQSIAGVNFSNPIGLSAGFDKDANLQNVLYQFGFGYMQVGSVTNKPYKGNPKPRLFRLPKSKGVVVYYGLKNKGVKKIIKKLKKYRNDNFPLSISIAKTNSDETSSDEGGINDYYECMKSLVKKQIGSFYTINISCPNTFGGEPFTTPEKLTRLLEKLSKIKTAKPVFIKMPINLEWVEFEKLLKVITKYNITGVIIGNLNKDHNSQTVKDIIPEHIKGGISGKPTWELSNNLISKTYKEYGDKLKIVGVGGVFSAKDAYEKIKLGSSLVQLITGMIYEGPQLIGNINYDLVKLLEKDGYKNVSEAVGSAHR